MFRDITTLLKDASAFRTAADALAARYKAENIELVAGVESRGFILGAAIADRLGAGFIPIRKPGKLPAPTLRQSYALEYGTDAIEIHKDAIRAGQRVLLHDDLLATGGTMAAACALVDSLGGVVAGVAFLIELSFLDGRSRLPGRDLFSLVRYDAE
jgi:adenine phosphoribosyltransferase